MISTVIYFIGKVLTFPGAYIKAFFEHLIARAFSIPVEDTKYLRFTDGCGHVEHDAIGSKAKIFFYCLLPGLFTAIIGTPMLYMGFAGLFFFKIPADHVIVLCDDITQSPGKLRIRPSGSAGEPVSAYGGCDRSVARALRQGRSEPVREDCSLHPDRSYYSGRVPREICIEYSSHGRHCCLRRTDSITK